MDNENESNRSKLYLFKLFVVYLLGHFLLPFAFLFTIICLVPLYPPSRSFSEFKAEDLTFFLILNVLWIASVALASTVVSRRFFTKDIYKESHTTYYLRTLIVMFLVVNIGHIIALSLGKFPVPLLNPFLIIFSTVVSHGVNDFFIRRGMKDFKDLHKKLSISQQKLSVCGNAMSTFSVIYLFLYAVSGKYQVLVQIVYAMMVLCIKELAFRVSFGDNFFVYMAEFISDFFTLMALPATSQNAFIITISMESIAYFYHMIRLTPIFYYQVEVKILVPLRTRLFSLFDKKRNKIGVMEMSPEPETEPDKLQMMVESESRSGSLSNRSEGARSSMELLETGSVGSMIEFDDATTGVILKHEDGLQKFRWSVIRTLLLVSISKVVCPLFFASYFVYLTKYKNKEFYPWNTLSPATIQQTINYSLLLFGVCCGELIVCLIVLSQFKKIRLYDAVEDLLLRFKDNFLTGVIIILLSHAFPFIMLVEHSNCWHYVFKIPIEYK